MLKLKDVLLDYALVDFVLVADYSLLKVLVLALLVHFLLSSSVDELAVFVDNTLVDEGLQLLPCLHESDPELITHNFDFAVGGVETASPLTGKRLLALSVLRLLLYVVHLFVLQIAS